MRALLFWLKAARAPFFTGSLAPILVGTALGYFAMGGWAQWDLAALALVALILLHASANLSNDYFDHLSGTDEINTTYASPFTGGSRVIQEGLAHPGHVLAASVVSMALGAAIGFYLVYRSGWPILWLGLIGGLTGFFYTAPPLRFAYRGWGEIFIFLDFGVLPVLGAYYLQTQRFELEALLASMPVALLITDILWINQFQDAEADAAVGKRHGVVRLGRRRAAYVHVAFLVLTYISIIAPVALRLFPPTTLAALLATPIAYKAGRTALQHFDNLPQLTPANASTIATHFITSVLFALGFFLAGLYPA